MAISMVVPPRQTIVAATLRREIRARDIQSVRQGVRHQQAFGLGVDCTETPEPS